MASPSLRPNTRITKAKAKQLYRMVMQLHVETLRGNEWKYTRSCAWAYDKAHIHGLLSMGVSGTAYPFSFGQRGLPPVMSPQITFALETDIQNNSQVWHSSWLTRDEVDAKAVELLISPHEKALSVRTALIAFLKDIPAEPNQRFVFWFLR